MGNVTRRRFLQSAAAAAAGLAAPTVLPARVFAAPPGGKLTVGVIGNGIMGDRLRRLFAGFPDSQVVAVCDVNPDFRRKVGAQMPGVKLYSDFRELLDRKDVDAVVIATPHHSHAWIILAALKSGKHIYCEKPLTHTIQESRAVLDAARAGKQVLQHGTHRRAGDAQRLGCELIRNQKIGKLHTIRIMGRPGVSKEARPADPELPVPEGFDWDLWLGPAPFVKFCGVHDKRLWNKYSDYSTGHLTLTDCHLVDIALWAADPFLKGPVEIEGKMNPDAEAEYRVTFKYAGGVTVICDGTNAKPDSPGVKFEGTEGWVMIDVFRYKLTTQPDNLKTAEIGKDEIHLPVMKHQHKVSDHRLTEWQACCEDFVQAVKQGREPACPVEDAHKMTILSDLIWIGSRLGRKLMWDDKKERFVDDDEANKLLGYEYRKPYTL